MRMPDGIPQYSIIPQMAPRAAPEGFERLSEFGMKESRKRVAGNLCQDTRQARPMKTKELRVIGKRHSICFETRV